MGTGGPIFEGDIAIVGDRIAAIGRVVGSGVDEIDAKGLLVTPGFIDLHTHYDGQAVWSERLTSSSWHGVTTAVLGNCGVGFAPVRPHETDTLVELMEGVEDIPGVVLNEGLDWEWESFDDYARKVAARGLDFRVRSSTRASSLATGRTGARPGWWDTSPARPPAA